MPIPFNVGHCRGITERFKNQIQHNSNYVVFSDSGKSLVTSPLLEVWARTRQRNICAEIPVSRSITARSERVQRHNAQSDGGQSTDTVSERVPTRQRTANEQRESQDEARTKQEKTKNWTPNELRKTQRTEGEQWKMSVYSVQIRAFLGVFCVRYIIILLMPLQRRTEPQRAVITHSESSIIKTCCKYQFLQTVWRIRATPHFTTFHIIWQCFNNVCIVLIRNQTDSTQHTTNLMK